MAFGMRPSTARALVIACVATACASRPELPPPVLPLTPTPDAPFRTRRADVPDDLPRSDLAVRWHRLDNGLTIAHVERPELPSVVVQFVNRRAGTLRSAYPGELVRLTAKALVHGGTRFADGQVLSDVRVNGTTVVAATGPEATTLSLHALSPAFDTALRVLSRTVTSPVFSDIGTAQNGLAQDAADGFNLTGNLAWERGLVDLIGATTTHRLLGARPERILAFGVEDVKRCYSDLYRPESSALVVVGDVTFPDALAAVERHFGAWKNAAPDRGGPPARVAWQPPRAGVRIALVHRPSDPLARVFVAQRAPSVASKEAAGADISAAVLGGLFESRMNRALRHERGATYGVVSRCSPLADVGLMLIHGQFEVGAAASSVERLLLELRRLQREALTEHELRAARVRVLSEEAETASHSWGAAALVTALFAYEDPELISRFESDLGTVTAEEVRSVAARYLTPRALEIVVFGDASRLVRPLRRLGSVSLYRITEPLPLRQE